jgi:hypothetical protein
VSRFPSEAARGSLQLGAGQQPILHPALTRLRPNGLARVRREQREHGTLEQHPRHWRQRGQRGEIHSAHGGQWQSLRAHPIGTYGLRLVAQRIAIVHQVPTFMGSLHYAIRGRANRRDRRSRAWEAVAARRRVCRQRNELTCNGVERVLI